MYPVPVAPDGVRGVSEPVERILPDCILEFALDNYCQMRAIFVVHRLTFRSFVHCVCSGASRDTDRLISRRSAVTRCTEYCDKFHI